MRRIRYAVAASVDGYIAGPAGEFDWITSDPDIDFEALFAQFDTFLVGRRTFEMMPAGEVSPGAHTFVFSRTLRQEDHPGVTVVSDGVEELLKDLRSQPGKDIWLFGGGILFRSLLKMGQVDTVEIAFIPVLLGKGLPLLPPTVPRHSLSLERHRVYGTGIVLLEYAVGPGQAAPAPAPTPGRRSGG